MWDWLSKLLRKDGSTDEAPSASSGEADAAKARKRVADLSAPRKLSPVDSPTILARLKTLGVLDFLDPNQEQALKRIVLTHCREGRVEMWWWPLCEFVRSRKTHRGGVPFQVLEARCDMGRSLKERVIAVEEFFRTEGLQFRKIRSPAGDPVHDREPLQDGVYRMKYHAGDREGGVEIAITGGRIDVPALIAQLNEIARSNRWGYRLVRLAPEKSSHCVIRCTVGTAERAERSGWGSVPYPPSAGG